jgi:type IV secretory pathway component VirB8
VIVEIRDAMIDPRITFDISTDDRDLLERAESHLVGSDSALATTSPVPYVEERES